MDPFPSQTRKQALGNIEQEYEPRDGNVQSGQATGWAAMHSLVREFDEERVKDTKEDIDTILVFAGLFSAVLTAFLVVSYQRLLPDTASQMLTISSQTLAAMQQISLQMSNSSTRPLAIATDTIPFQPSNADIRINVLWFASLIFSLITASFGMLVKQWLREYLAVENPSPRARLRIRHYREPALRHWKVFEIAAVLPLVQQLSLALFFIGLCYFTASVHDSIGHTSLPLVAGWAFCFSTVAILPLFFPRCPFKTTLLKSIFSSIHQRSTHVIERMMYSLDDAVHSEWDWLYRLWECLSRYEGRRLDEGIAVSIDDADLDILAEVDALQSNDELIGTTIFESLQQVHEPEWADILQLVFRLMEHRLQINLQSEPPRPLDLMGFSQPAYTGIIDIISYYIAPELQRILSCLQYCQGDLERQSPKLAASLQALYLFFSDSRYPLPKSGFDLLTEIFHDQSEGVALICVLVRRCPSKKLAGLLQVMRKRMHMLNLTTTASLQYFETSINAIFNRTDSSQRNHAIVGPFVFQQNMSAWPWDPNVWTASVSGEALEWIADIITRVLRQEPDFVNDHKANSDSDDEQSTAVSQSQFIGSLACMWHLAQTAQGSAALSPLYAAINDCLSRAESTVCLLKALGQTQESAVAGVCAQFTIECLPEITDAMLQNFTAAVNKLYVPLAPPARNTDTDSRSSLVTAAHGLKILCFALHLTRPPEALQRKEHCRVLFEATVHNIYQSMGVTLQSNSPPSSGIIQLTPYHGNPTPQIIQFIRSSASPNTDGFLSMANACLEHIQWQDIKSAFLDWNWRWFPGGPRTDYGKWMSRFNPQDAVCHDGFVEILGAIYIVSCTPGRDDEIDRICYRARKLGVLEKVRRAISVLDEEAAWKGFVDSLPFANAEPVDVDDGGLDDDYVDDAPDDGVRGVVPVYRPSIKCGGVVSTQSRSYSPVEVESANTSDQLGVPVAETLMENGGVSKDDGRTSVAQT